MALQKNKRIAIVSVNAEAYSETFIKAHIDQLEGDKYLLYGGYKPLYFSGRSLVLNISSVKRFVLKYIQKKDLLDYSIRQFLLKNRINIILAEYGPTGCAMLPFARELGIPLIVHFHGYDASSEKLLNEYRDKYKQMFHHVRLIISVSLQMQLNLIRMGADMSKVVYNPYGPASEFNNVTPDYDNSDSVLFVGRFVDKKAPYLLVEIIKRIVASGTVLKLVMAGDGVLLDTCKTMVKIASLETYVLFPGAVTHSEVKELMSKSFCYIQHSITTSDGETEGTPVSILEASQAGLPVLSTRHAGIPDVIIHGETGFLVDEFDIESMAGYLLQLYHNRRLAREMGNNGKKRIAENFSLDRHIAFLDNEIDKALNGN